VCPVVEGMKGKHKNWRELQLKDYLTFGHKTLLFSDNTE
jgi:hypothetical protein